MSEFTDIEIQTELGESSWFGFSMVLTGKLSGKRQVLIELLTESGIESRPIVAGNFTRNPVISHLPHEPRVMHHVPLGQRPCGR